MSSSISGIMIGSAVNYAKHQSKAMPKQSNRKKYIMTLLTVICVVILPKLVNCNEEEDLKTPATDSIPRRLILNLFDTTEKIKHPINADHNSIAPHNKICNEYLEHFFDGSTDEDDECEALDNAYDAGGCGEIPLGTNYYDETNSTDDGIGIDDAFEVFQCCRFIHDHYSEKCLRAERLASLSLLGIVSVLILCAFVKTLIHGYQLHWLPEAGGCILVGAVFGTILRMVLPNHELSIGTFNDDLFLFILLPPIIFNASLSIDKVKFRSCIFPIAMFAIFGAIISAVITGFFVYGITNIFSLSTPSIPLLDSMIFGALISSVDPVATLSVLGSMGVSETEFLYVVVFGESILNDGVSIALFESLVLHLDDNVQLDGAIVMESALFFLKVTSVSIVVGLACGVLSSIYFWCLRGRQSPVSEVASFFCFALLAYYISDSMNCSGIVAIMVAGFFMDVYVRGRLLSEADLHRQILQSEESDNAIDGGAILPPRCGMPSLTDWKVIFSGVGHISHRAKVHVGFVAEVLSNIMETSIFAYLGIFLFSPKTLERSYILEFFLGIFSSVASRLLMIGIISVIINGFSMIRGYVSNPPSLQNSNDHIQGHQSETGYIDRHMLLILLYSGVRGAVSLALVDNIPIYNVVTKHGSKFKPILKGMTCSSIFFTVFIFGGLTYRTLKKQRDMINSPSSTERYTELPLGDRRPTGESLADASLTSLLLEEVSHEVRS